MAGSGDEAITVFIPVRNAERYVGQAVDSVLGQSHRDLRLVVADNCSDDRTREVAAARGGDPRLELVARERNLGMFGNFNACLDAVETPYYMVLCADDYLAHPRALEAGLAALRAEPAAAVAYCDLLYVDETGRRVASRRFGRSGPADPEALARRSVVTLRNQFGIPLLVRSEALGTLRYDESLTYLADVDLSLATARGRGVVHVPELLIANRYHAGNRTRDLMVQAPGQFNRLMAKHGIRLTPAERLARRGHALLIPLLKRAFFLFLRLRSLLPANPEATRQ